MKTSGIALRSPHPFCLPNEKVVLMLILKRVYVYLGELELIKNEYFDSISIK